MNAASYPLASGPSRSPTAADVYSIANQVGY